MPQLPSRKSLEAMKRVDLQRICKDYGVKANLKSEALIDLLLATQSPQVVQPPSTRRSTSTRQSSRAGLSRVTSMIVHDAEEDSETQEVDRGVTEDSLDNASTAPSESLVPPPRTRKAKELQKRLGVGKPVIAGGQGPRAITRSSGSSRGKRAKSSKSIKPREATIEEEPESVDTTLPEIRPQDARSTAGSSLSSAPKIIDIPPSIDHQSLDVPKLVEQALFPLHAQIRQLQAEVDQAKKTCTDLADLRTQVARITKAQAELEHKFESFNDISTSIESLQEDILQLKVSFAENGDLPRPSTPKPKNPTSKQATLGFGLPSAFRSIAQPPIFDSPKTPTQPSAASPSMRIPPSTLGKRHRDSTNSNVAGSIDDEEHEQPDIRPTRKRARVQTENSSIPTSQPTGGESREEGNDFLTPAGPAFTVFTDGDNPSEYMDPPPPTEHLPDFFEPRSPSESQSNAQAIRSASGAPITRSATAAENQPNAFSFAFVPISSTPNAMYLPTFPYLEPPTSPSPASTNTTPAIGRHQNDRKDIFKDFGLPSPIRSKYGSVVGAQPEESNTVDPAALTQTSSVKQGKQKEKSDEPDAGADATTSDDMDSSENPLTKRTMFGTELEGDTRFGDFGVEGVASGFWARF